MNDTTHHLEENGNVNCGLLPTTIRYTMIWADVTCAECKKHMSGQKFDSGKARMSLIAPDALEGLATILTYGEKKYVANNWCKGMAWSRVIDAAMRHLSAFNRGENLDSESGLPHIDHALCCLMFLSAYQKRGSGTDDRYTI